MSTSRRALLQALLASPLAAAATPARAAGRFSPPDDAERRDALGSLDDLPPALRAAFEPTADDRPIPAPGPDDWLTAHPEGGQSFNLYVRLRPNLPTTRRSKIYLLPLDFTAGADTPKFAVLADFTARYFQLPAVRGDALTMRDLAAHSRSRGTYRQYYTRDILDALRSRVPADAYCLIAVTTLDLYPDPDWNFVFGQATLSERVGVYSLARYDPAFFGDPRGPDIRALILRRSLKVLAHEVGHMFGIRHCTHFHCVMNGSNHLDESDASPLHPCPICLRKLHYAVDFDPAERERKLARLFRARDLVPEAERCERRLAAIARAR
jgi:archaemetzincin